MDLIIVGTRHDEFAVEFAKIAQQQGYIAEILNVCEAAQLFTIKIDSPKASVTPDLPLLLRMPSPSILREDFDSSFHDGECLAALWAAASLCKSPVLNRPTYNSFWGRSSNSAVLTQIRSGLSAQEIEVFSAKHKAPPQVDLHQSWLIQDLVTYEDAVYPAIPEGNGPYRWRCTTANPAYEMVVVLGKQAWRCTSVPLEHLHLEQQSISLIKKLDLAFAVVIWTITPELDQAKLFGINSFPSMQQVQFVWTALAPALLEALIL